MSTIAELVVGGLVFVVACLVLIGVVVGGERAVARYGEAPVSEPWRYAMNAASMALLSAVVLGVLGGYGYLAVLLGRWVLGR